MMRLSSDAAALAAGQTMTASRLRTTHLLVRWLRRLVLAAGLFLLLSVPMSGTDAFLGFRVTDPPFASLTYSIQTFLWWDSGWAGTHLDWVQRMAFSHIKQTFAWEDIEPRQGVFAFQRADEILGEIERRNLRIIVRLSDAPAWSHPDQPGERGVDYVDAPPDNVADFAAYCGAVASRYAGRIDAYQVWNEPNLGREWGNRRPDAQGYARLLQACSDAIRAADPLAIIISAGLAPTGNDDAMAVPDDVYLQQLYDAGFQQYIDVLGAHAPGYTAPWVAPEEAPGGHRFFAFRRPEDLRRIMIANGDAARQMAILETGYTTDRLHDSMAWFAVTEFEQAVRMVEAYQFAADHWRPWVGLMSAIYIADPGWSAADEEMWWAITTPDGYTRRSYIDLANMAKYCGDAVLPARAPDSPEALGLAPVTPCA
jgi:hypothetical protein